MTRGSQTMTRSASGTPQTGQNTMRGGGWLLQSLPAQILSGVLICSVLPAVARWKLELIYEPTVGQITSLLATSLAWIISLLILRRLASYPGVQSSTYVIPSLVTGFGVVLLTIILFRFEFTRYQITASIMLSVLWAYFMFWMVRDREGLRLDIVPVGNVDLLLEHQDIRSRAIQEPELSALQGDAVVADLRADLSPEWERLLAACALSGIPVFHVKQIQESLTGRVQIEHLSENNLGSLLPSPSYARIKRVIDWLTSVAALLVLWPFLLLLALAIRMDSPGPAIYRQTRVGYRGTIFTMYKFRSMDVARKGTDFTAPDDDRITRIGRVIRKYRIDELPQILNILKGQMSWIGPRPEARALSEWYATDIPFYAYRHVVRPGITGWAQVQQGYGAGLREVTDKLYYDFFYIKNFSLWMDILIAMKTVKTLLTGFGSR